MCLHVINNVLVYGVCLFENALGHICLLIFSSMCWYRAHGRDFVVATHVFLHILNDMLMYEVHTQDPFRQHKCIDILNDVFV